MQCLLVGKANGADWKGYFRRDQLVRVLAATKGRIPSALNHVCVVLSVSVVEPWLGKGAWGCATGNCEGLAPKTSCSKASQRVN